MHRSTPIRPLLPLRLQACIPVRVRSLLALALAAVLGACLVASPAALAQGQRRRGFRAPIAREPAAAPAGRSSFTPAQAGRDANPHNEPGQTNSRNEPFREQPQGSSATQENGQGDGQGRPNHPYAQQNQPFAAGQSQGHPAGQGQGQGPGLINPNRPRQAQEHIGQWMESHRNLSLDQQQRALEAEPGFRQLPPQAQQRLHQRLQQLNSMPPDQRARVTERTEAMERLSPPQRQQVRDAYAQLGALPEDRRRAVARTFNTMLALPPAERGNYLNSPQVRGQFNDHERDTLNKLLTAPYLPEPATAPRPAPPAPYPR